MDLRNYYNKILFLTYFLSNNLKCPVLVDFIAKNVMKRTMQEKDKKFFLNTNVVLYNLNECNNNIRKNISYSYDEVVEIIKSKFCLDNRKESVFKYSLFKSSLYYLKKLSNNIESQKPTDDPILNILKENEFNFLFDAMINNMDIFSNKTDYIDIKKEKEAWSNVFEIILFESFLCRLSLQAWEAIHVKYPIIMQIISKDIEVNLFVHLCMAKLDSSYIMTRMYEKIDVFSTVSSVALYDLNLIERSRLKVDSFFFFFLICLFHNNFAVLNPNIVAIQKHIIQNSHACECGQCKDFKYFFTRKVDIVFPKSLFDFFKLKKNNPPLVFFFTVIKQIYKLLWFCFGKNSFKYFRKILIGGKFTNHDLNTFDQNYVLKKLELNPISKIYDRFDNFADIENGNYDNFLNYPVLCCYDWKHVKYVESRLELLKHDRMLYYKCKIPILKDIDNIPNFWVEFLAYFSKYVSNYIHNDFFSPWPDHILNTVQFYIFNYNYNGQICNGMLFSSGLLFKLCFNSYFKQYLFSNIPLYIPFPISLFKLSHDIYENLIFVYSRKSVAIDQEYAINSCGLDLLKNIFICDRYLDCVNSREKIHILELILNKISFSLFWVYLIKPYNDKKNIILDYDNLDVISFKGVEDNIYSSIKLFLNDDSNIHSRIVRISTIKKIYSILCKKTYEENTLQLLVPYITTMPDFKLFCEQIMKFSKDNPKVNFVNLRKISKHPVEICRNIYALCASDILSEKDSIELFFSLKSSDGCDLTTNLQLYKYFSYSMALLDDGNDFLVEKSYPYLIKSNLHQLVYLSLYLSSFSRSINVNFENQVVDAKELSDSSSGQHIKKMNNEYYLIHGKNQYIGSVCYEQILSEIEEIYYISETRQENAESPEKKLNTYFFPIATFQKRHDDDQPSLTDDTTFDFSLVKKNEKKESLYPIVDEIFNFLNSIENCDRLFFILN